MLFFVLNKLPVSSSRQSLRRELSITSKSMMELYIKCYIYIMYYYEFYSLSMKKFIDTENRGVFLLLSYLIHTCEYI